MKSRNRNVLVATTLLTGAVMGCGDFSATEVNVGECKVYSRIGDDSPVVLSDSDVTVEMIDTSGTEYGQLRRVAGRVVEYASGQLVKASGLSATTSNVHTEGFSEPVALVIRGVDDQDIGVTKECVFRENFQYDTYYTYVYVPDTE